MIQRDVIDHEAEVTYSLMDWMILLLSIVFQVALLKFCPDFAWVGLPFWMTYTIKALRQL